MSKIFRLHNGATENIEHWQQIDSHLSDNFINSIEDPAGANVATQITSIPSPFARMDLIRTSFRFVNNSGNLDGNTIYHRMVSECLDIAEIFFNAELLKDKIEIIEWNSGITLKHGELDIDVNSDLGRLIHSSNPKHKLLGDTLSMFLKQDKNAFNFHKLGNIYLLNYIGKGAPDILNIIGGTSPSTLFFSSANHLHYVDIIFANDRMLDISLYPLYKRGKDFVKYIYAFRRAYPGFAIDFADIDNYLGYSFDLLDEDLKQEIKKFDENTYAENYAAISVGNGGNTAEILGFKLRAKNVSAIDAKANNDFIIDTEKNYSGVLPCVLPVEKNNDNLNYMDGKWLDNYHKNVPYKDDRPLDKRTLPNQSHIQYPYLTVSDFLEPYLIQVPYPIDEAKFFDGNYKVAQGEKDHGYLLPLKKIFFSYFTSEQLQGLVSDGKKMFEMEQMLSGVKVTLRIPVQKNNYITFTRTYNRNQFQDRIMQPDEINNQGVIVENQMTVLIYPQLKIEGINPHYRVVTVDRDIAPLTRNNDYSLTLYKETNTNAPEEVALKDVKQRSKKSQNGVSTTYNIVNHNFDIIEVSNKKANAILIPKFIVKESDALTKAYKFAIDFGTTNTHIEYVSATENETRPLDIEENDVQYMTLHKPGKLMQMSLSRLGFGADDLLSIINEEFKPELISSERKYHFPTRTVINDNNKFNETKENYALADFNIPFWYLKEDYKLNSEITAGLKWSNFQDVRLEKRTKAFIEQMMLMIRNKILLNNGSLDKAEIIWLYPSSMESHRLNFFKSQLLKYKNEYFTKDTKINTLTESIAPYWGYAESSSDKPVLNIDIGGGTTDAVVFLDNQPVLLTSFHFASSAIFGDGYNDNGKNGFIAKYENKIINSLESTGQQKLSSIYKSLKAKSNNSIELIEFFFSLEDNAELKENNISISFSEMLTKDENLKIVFLIFYIAIVYHLAKIMHLKNLQQPRYITFSGNGSKLLNVLTFGSDMHSLQALTNLVFDDIYDVQKQQQQQEIELILEDRPKEISSKGALKMKGDIAGMNKVEDKIKVTLSGTSDNVVLPEKSLQYAQINDEEVINSVLLETNIFFDKFFKWNNIYGFYKNFGVTPAVIEKSKIYVREDLKTYLKDGINARMKNIINKNEDIEETLFFYPVIGVLNKLAYKVSNE